MSFEIKFHFSFWLSLYSLLYQNEAMSALDQFKKRTSKREVESTKEWEEKNKRKKIAES